MKKAKRSAVDVSRELIIDSIVLTQEVLHSIQNNLPIPLDNVTLSRVDSTAELAAYERAEPSLLFLALTLLVIGALIMLLMI